MKLAAWLLKLGFFLLVLWFALKNTTPVPVRFSSELAWDSSADRGDAGMRGSRCVAWCTGAIVADLQDASRSGAAQAVKPVTVDLRVFGRTYGERRTSIGCGR